MGGLVDTIVRYSPRTEVVPGMVLKISVMICILRARGGSSLIAKSTFSLFLYSPAYAEVIPQYDNYPGFPEPGQATR